MTVARPSVLIYAHSFQPTLADLYGPPDEDEYCPVSQVWVSTTTGEILGRYGHCRRNTCPPCVRIKARALAKRLAKVRPTEMLTITHLPDNWSEAQPVLAEFMRTTRRAGHDWLWCHAIERDPNLAGAHLHAWTRGDVPPTEVLTKAASRTGLGTVHRQRVVHHGGLDYQWKTPGWSKAANEDARLLNGSQMWHTSRGYWR